MYHRIDDLIAKVNVIKEKSDSLQNLQGTDPDLTQYVIDDIQALCADIANDRGIRAGGEDGF